MHVVDDNADGMGAVGMVLFGHVGVQSLGVDAIEEFRLEPSLDEQHRPLRHLARVVGDGGNRGVRSGQIRHIKGPAVGRDDLAE